MVPGLGQQHSCANKDAKRRHLNENNKHPSLKQDMNLALAWPEAETFSLASAMILPRLNRQLRLPPINFTKKEKELEGKLPKGKI